jgi:hypothetical protein
MVESDKHRRVEMLKRFAFTDAVKRTVSSDGSLIVFEGQTLSGRDFSISTRLADAQRWLNGESIQNCFQHLNAEQREILMTGFDDVCWERMFAGSESDE